MKWRGCGYRRYGIRPMMAVLRGHCPAETNPTTDLAYFRASEFAHAVPHATTAFACKTRGQRRVLVVDDDEVIRRLIAANLTLEGFDVATAVDGQDCLDKAPAIAPDVITLDVIMPHLDGWETALRLRKCPVTSHIKIVLITARDHKVDGEMIRIVRKLADATPTAFM